ncbi:hypothetical protein COV20_06230 [Candidatus Woesearchaeota archaeon CG10_big_fil_rev_8_21_14_0_10_45_16]|nr:MAG: hypothetical protein COV20_06230 [Candidatus Woesearchaeota archaeon CG10_big_fil_rev_8_21_14_0_10_45_16]
MVFDERIALEEALQIAEDLFPVFSWQRCLVRDGLYQIEVGKHRECTAIASQECPYRHGIEAPRMIDGQEIYLPVCTYEPLNR